VCDRCTSQGITLDAVKALQEHADRRAAEQLPRERWSAVDLRSREQHGKLLRRFFAGTGTGQPAPVGSGRGQSAGRWYLGRVWFRGPGLSDQLAVAFEDGDIEFTTLRKLSRQQVEWLPTDWAIPAGTQFPSLEQAEVELLRRQAELESRRARRPAATRMALSSTERDKAGPRTPSLRNVVASGVSLSMAPAAVAAAPSVASPPAVDTQGTPVVTPSHQAETCLPDTWTLTESAGLHAAMQLLMPGPLAAKDSARIANRIRMGLSKVACGTCSTARVGAYPHGG
jgi:hypothetical protein